MKEFALDEHGDVIIGKQDIKTVQNTELTVQKIRQVLQTNRGEWWLDEKEGIPMQKILKKNPNISMIRDYIRNAIAQVDKTLQMTECNIVTEGRTLKIDFTLSGVSGQTSIEMEV